MARKNKSAFEAYNAFCNLLKLDFRIRCHLNTSINFGYKADCCYFLSCGYRVTEKGIFDSKGNKICIGRYKNKIFVLAKQRFEMFKTADEVVTNLKMPIKKFSH
ncbi:MAG: hypothetical protein K6B71_00340 [Alphaproteobacteria bacterium]|nr:hypothetical protein [Alphaproteobacteria bacterium]